MFALGCGLAHDGNFRQLRDGVCDALFDRDDHMTAAEIVRELCRESLRRCGVELARHIDEQDILCADRVHVEGCGDGRVNAARDTDDDALHMDACEKFLHGVAQHPMDGSDGRLCMRQNGSGKRVRVNDGYTLRVGRGHGDAFACSTEYIRSTGECVDRLALVLKSEGVDVENIFSLFVCCLGKGGCAEANGEGTRICGEDDVLVRHLIEEWSKLISRAVQR